MILSASGVEGALGGRKCNNRWKIPRPHTKARIISIAKVVKLGVIHEVSTLSRRERIFSIWIALLLSSNWTHRVPSGSGQLGPCLPHRALVSMSQRLQNVGWGGRKRWPSNHFPYPSLHSLSSCKALPMCMFWIPLHVLSEIEPCPFSVLPLPTEGALSMFCGLSIPQISFQWHASSKITHLVIPPEMETKHSNICTYGVLFKPLRSILLSVIVLWLYQKANSLSQTLNVPIVFQSQPYFIVQNPFSDPYNLLIVTSHESKTQFLCFNIPCFKIHLPIWK